MRISNVRIRNFRALEKIDLKQPEELSVIAGPNAIGKTSVFEAIRLVKTFLAPTYPNETQETVAALGMALPGMQGINIDPIVGDPTKELVVEVEFALNDSELASLRQHASDLAIQRLLSNLATPAADSGAVARFLSTPVGKKQFEELQKQVSEELKSVEGNKTARIRLQIGGDRIARGSQPIAHESVALLSRLLPSYMHGLFSYFPADRAMPAGEASIQVGIGDAQAQRSSHLGNPGSKYARLKNFIVSQTLLGTDASQQLTTDFRLIFSELLDDKDFVGVNITPQGQVSARIKDKRNGREFDIDQLSSGEKGLLLTFLLMRLTVAPGGVVLLDEPELHLNAAVCRKLLPFVKTHICKAKHLQVLICTHSPEILATAYADDDCKLFHLRRKDEVTQIRSGDREEVNEALRCLGAHPIDMFHSRGFLYVEGEDDTELFAAGFDDLIRDLTLSKLGGRGEVEKEIRRLQDAERADKLDAPQFFLFDHDNKPSTLTSTAMVRVKQWKRYCFENYLLDAEAIYDAAKRNGGHPESLAWVQNQLEDLAKRNLQDQALRTACQGLPPAGMALKLTAVDGIENHAHVASILAKQYEAIRAAMENMSSPDWERAFVERLASIEADSKPSWDERWAELCDGKRVLHKLYKALKLRCSPLAFKRDIVEQLARSESAVWAEARTAINGLVKLEK